MNKILIVVDMQNDFITGSLGTAEAREIVPKVAEKIDNFDGRIILTKDTHKKDYLSTQEGRSLPVEHCIEGTHGHDICDELKAIESIGKAAVYGKGTFGSYELANALYGYALYRTDEKLYNMMHERISEGSDGI